jgi:superfamily I DNA/RNA helicase
VSRHGRKKGLAEPARRFVWTVYQEYQRRLAEISRLDYLDLSLRALHTIPNDRFFEPYDAVIVDEAQDLRPVELQVVSLLAGGASARNLILLADTAQSIYYQGVPWKEGGVHIAPARSLALDRNFRNSRQILQAAWSLAEDGISDDLDGEIISPQVAEHDGPKPIVVRCENDDWHDRFIVETIKHLCGEMKCRPGDIAVLARTNDHVDQLRNILRRAEIPVVHYRENDFDILENNVKVVTIHSAKGLEFPVVFLAGVNEGDLPRSLYFREGEELVADLRAERRLLYVGMTRAARRLYLISRDADSSRFIEELDPDSVTIVRYGS